MAPEAVTFDLDDTLLRYTESPDDVLARCFDRAGHEPFFTFGDYQDVFTQYVDEAETPLELRTAAFSALARENGYDPTAGRDVAEMWGPAHAAGEYELCPGADRVLESCCRSFDVGLITNGPSEAQQPKLEATGLTDLFDVEVYAADNLRFKPDPAPFEQALEALGTRPEHTVHVGDSLEADIEGAVDIGMEAVWIAADTTPSADVAVPRVDTVGDLLELDPFSALV